MTGLRRRFFGVGEFALLIQSFFERFIEPEEHTDDDVSPKGIENFKVFCCFVTWKNRRKDIGK